MDDDAFDPDDIPELDHPEPEPEPDSGTMPSTATPDGDAAFQPPSPPPAPVNWNLLSAYQAEQEWMQLNGWVNWLRATYGLPAAILPPMWHRHWELIWELSALHTHWLTCYHPTRDGSGPLLWHADFAAACNRLRNWVTINGTKLDRDRPTRQTAWPGENPSTDSAETLIDDRDKDFVQFAHDDVQRRAAKEAAREARK